MPRPERPLSPDDGPVQKFAAELRKLRREAGQPSYRQMAKLAGYSVTTLSDAAGGRQLPGLAVVLAYVRCCAGDEAAWEERWRETAAQVAALREPSAAEGGPGTPPYQGLAGFQRADADRFFGRDRVVRELVDRLAQTRFLAVFGPSGVGKSSVLRAGLIPALGEERVLLITPGDHPAKHQAALDAARGGLIVVDQFEEVFTLCREGTEREVFLGTLLDLAHEPDRQTRVVLGVRADFLAACAQHPELAEAMSEHTAVIGPMHEEELQQAVTGPAGPAGLTVERALIAQVLAETRGQPGALPLLSHALLETWRQRRANTMTLAGYQATGGISGAIAHTAEEVYAGFDPEHQALIQSIMIRLTALGEGTEDTRRRVRLSEVDFDGAGAVIDALVRARLVVLGEDTVEIAHEALIGAWPRLRRWLTDDRDSLLRHRQLTEDAELWESLGRDPSALLRGTRLAIVHDIDSHRTLNAGERSFWEASIAAELAELATATTRAQQLNRLSRFLGAMLAAVAVAACVAIWQWNNAADQTALATSRELAIHGLSVAPIDVSQGLRLSLRAHAEAPTVEARSALLSLAARHAFTGILRHHQPVKDIAFAADGQTMVVATQDSYLVVWDVPHRREIGRLADGHNGAVRAVAVSSEGMVASGGLDGSVVLWRLSTLEKIRVLRPPGEESRRMETLAFSPDGKLLAASARNTPTELWRVPDGTSWGTLPDRGGSLTEVVFSPDGQRLATAGSGQTEVIWDLATRRVVATSPPIGTVPQVVAFSPDGRTLALGGDMADVVLWDSATGQLSTLKGHTRYVRAVSFTPDGKRLVSAGFDEYAIVWDVARRAPLTRLTGQASEIYTVAISPDGQQVATGGRDRSVLLFGASEMPWAAHTDNITSVEASRDGRLLFSAGRDRSIVVWDIATRALIATLTGHTDRVSDLALSPDGSILASSSDDHTVRLWSASRLTPLKVIEAAKDIVLGLAFSPDGRLLAAHTGSVIRVFAVDTGEAVATITTPPPADRSPKPMINRLTFGGDPQTLLVACTDGSIAIQDLTGKVSLRLSNPDTVADLSLDPTRTKLALGLSDGSVVVWDLLRRTSVSVPGAHSGGTNRVRFSPDGKLLASAGVDDKVALWTTSDLRLWAQLSGHGADVQGLSWAPDSSAVFSGSVDHTVTRWVVEPEEAVRLACAELRSDFAVDEPACG